MNGEVIQRNPDSSLRLVVQTNAFQGHEEISPGCTLKLNRNKNNLFVLASSQKIMVLMDLDDSGFSSIVSINGLVGHPISDFKPIGDNIVVSLSGTGMITVHRFDRNGSTLIHYLLLREEIPFHDSMSSILFEICSQDKFMIVSLHNSFTMKRDKLVFIEFEDGFLPKVAGLLDFHACDDQSGGSHADPDGGVITTMNMDFYCNGFPLVICSEHNGDRRLQIYHMEDKSFIKVYDQAGESLGIDVKRHQGNLLSIDREGRLIIVEVSDSAPDFRSYSGEENQGIANRSTPTGNFVSARVTPSRIIPHGCARHKKYLNSSSIDTKKLITELPPIVEVNSNPKPNQGTLRHPTYTLRRNDLRPIPIPVAAGGSPTINEITKNTQATQPSQINQLSPSIPINSGYQPGMTIQQPSTSGIQPSSLLVQQPPQINASSSIQPTSFGGGQSYPLSTRTPQTAKSYLQPTGTIGTSNPGVTRSAITPNKSIYNPTTNATTTTAFSPGKPLQYQESQPTPVSQPAFPISSTTSRVMYPQSTIFNNQPIVVNRSPYVQPVVTTDQFIRAQLQRESDGTEATSPSKRISSGQNSIIPSNIQPIIVEVVNQSEFNSRKGKRINSL